jgi:3-oxoacyl-(acyl-carrier-protein) synthase
LDFTSAHATSTEEEENNELDSYDDKTSQEAQSAGWLFKIWPVYK